MEQSWSNRSLLPRTNRQLEQSSNAPGTQEEGHKGVPDQGLANKQWGYDGCHHSCLQSSALWPLKVFLGIGMWDLFSCRVIFCNEVTGLNSEGSGRSLRGQDSVVEGAKLLSTLARETESGVSVAVAQQKGAVAQNLLGAASS